WLDQRERRRGTGRRAVRVLDRRHLPHRERPGDRHGHGGERHLRRHPRAARSQPVTLSADASLAYLQTLCAMPDVDPATGAVDTNGTASKASIIAIAQGAGLSAGDFVEGDPAERFLEYAGRAMAAWGTVPTQAMRAFFFALCTDPGDVDDFGAPDLSADQTPRPGVLSAFGAGWWGTERGGQTIATSTLVIQNAGDSATLP